MKRLILIVSALSFLACARGQVDYPQNKVEDTTVDSIDSDTTRSLEGRWYSKATGSLDSIQWTVVFEIDKNGNFEYMNLKETKTNGTLVTYAEIARGVAEQIDHYIYLTVTSSSCPFPEKIKVSIHHISEDMKTVELRFPGGSASKVMTTSDTIPESEARGIIPDTSCNRTL